MQINGVMIVIFTIMLTDLAVMNVNTHVLQGSISLLSVRRHFSFDIILLWESFCLNSLLRKIILTCNSIRILVEPEKNLSVSLNLTTFTLSSALVTFV